MADQQAPVLVAKMFLAQRAETFQGNEKSGEQLQLNAVSGKDGTANAQWSRWTPSGQLTLHVTNPEAVGKVERGYYKILLVPCGEED